MIDWKNTADADRGGDADDVDAAVVEEAESGRTKMLARIFDGVAAASAVDRATLRQHFETPEKDRRPAHSPLLRSKTAHGPSDATLTEQVRWILRGVA